MNGLKVDSLSTESVAPLPARNLHSRVVTHSFWGGIDSPSSILLLSFVACGSRQANRLLLVCDVKWWQTHREEAPDKFVPSLRVMM